MGRVGGSPFNTMSRRPRPTFVLSGILIHPAVRPQQTWAENWGVPLGGAGSPSNTLWPGLRPTPIPSGHNRHGPKTEGLLCPLGGSGGGSPSNTMWSRPSSTSVSSGIFIRTKWHIHPSIFVGPRLTQCGRGRGRGLPLCHF